MLAIVNTIVLGEFYEGWYAPSQAGIWSITVTLPRQKMAGLTRAEVNGVSVHHINASEGVLELKGTSEPARPLRWLIR